MPANTDQQSASALELQSDAHSVTEFLKAFFERCVSAPPRLVESIEYSVFAGGKRLRPALVLECFRACSDAAGMSGKRGAWRVGSGESASSPSTPHSPPSTEFPPSTAFRSALASAAAMELIHTFSLVHDDLPAMDDDDLRRGRPTNHKVFGEAMAILAGDAMTTMAFEIIATDAEPDLAPALVRELARAAGPCGMVGGQVLDMVGENQTLDLASLQQIHRMKTGALLTTSCRLGAICARAPQARLHAVTEYGKHLGLAFQIIDDILDVTSTPEQLGKATNKDASHGKNTYPTLLGLENSQAEAARQLNLAISALTPLGEASTDLAALARFVVERKS